MSTNYAVLPGEWLLEYLDEKEISNWEFLEASGLDMDTLEGLFSGTVKIDAELAEVLYVSTSIPAKTWERYQKMYDEDSLKA